MPTVDHATDELLLEDRPWELLDELAARGDAIELNQFVRTLSAGDAARALAHLPDEGRTRVLTILTPGDAARLVEQLPERQAAELIELLSHGRAAAILDELPSDEQADILNELEDVDAEAVLLRMDPDEAADARRLREYDDDEAGGLMVTEYLSFPARSTAADILDNMRSNAEEYRDYHVQYAYITTGRDELLGVLRLRDLLLASPAVRADELMIANPLAVDAEAPLEELADIFDRKSYFGLPVTEAGRLVGVVRRADVEQALGTRAEQDYLKSTGIVGGEELRSMPLVRRSRRRLSWLSVNIVLNIIAASVIAFYQDTLSAVIALAVFLPIISDMSGCSGNQAVAVSIRELSLAVVKPRDVGYVWLKEISVGVINGIALGLLIGAVGWLWQGNPYLGLVVGGALAVNTMIAVSIGGTVPLLLERLQVDPALASGPVLTTITDLCGFLLVLSFATALLPQLTR